MQKLVPVLALTVALAGCAALPAVGPSASDVVNQQEVANVPRYAVIDISPAVIDILSHRVPDSLRARFGDYRPPVDPRIGIGDTLSVTIWEAAPGGLFSAPLLTDRFSAGSKSATIPDQVVGSDGAITVPYAGRIKVVGRSVSQVQSKIEAALAGKAIQPQVLVNIVHPVSNSVTVIGEVTNGARVPLSVKGDRLLDVIAAAGGIRAPVNETFVELSRGGRTARVSMARVVRDPRENIFMRPNDVVTLVRQPQTFMAYGATGRNAEIPFDSDNLDLAQALAKAGGLLDFRADPQGVFVLRYEPIELARLLVPGSPLLQEGTSVPIVYRLNLRDTNDMFLAQKFQIFAKDVIYVSNSALTDTTKFFQAIGLMAGPVGTAAAVYQVTK